MTQIKMTNTITLSKHNSLNTQMYKQSNTQSLPYICHKGTRRMDHHGYSFIFLQVLKFCKL
jgi:hypothetical protein